MVDDIKVSAEGSRRAALKLAVSSVDTRNEALEAIAIALEKERGRIDLANRKDLEAAEEMVERGELARPLVKRLALEAKFDATVEMVRSVAAQPDPLGRTQTATELADGLELYRVSVPIGVIGVIFESRPDALVQIASLCLKSGNAVLLKGGREAHNTNRVLAEIMIEVTAGVEGIPEGWLVLLESREDVRRLLDQDEHVDLIIPRGGNEFVRYIMDNTRIPVLGHADGVCHVYVDRDADLEKAVRIVVDSKTQYVAVCNAAEALLVHEKVGEAFLSRAYEALSNKGVEMRADDRARSFMQGNGSVKEATEQDWGCEYLDLKLAVRVVSDLQEAIDHINQYGSHHTDVIVTESKESAELFFSRVDSASVGHNVSTRFADGFKYGLGAEVGISTNRLHSRGPVGLEGLTIYKYLLSGDGHIVEEFEGPDARVFTHKPLNKPRAGI